MADARGAEVTAFAPAKINLTLEITGKRADGYHLLSSLVVFAADIGDRIRISPADQLSLTVAGPLSAGVPTGEGNLVMRAARRLAKARGIRAGAAITLEKHLPHGGGIGGGSADAAATIKALAKLWNVAPLSTEDALALGADVPVCLIGPAPALMEGIGEVLHPLPPLPECWLVLINPGVEIPTPRVFALHAELYGESDYRRPDPWATAKDLEDLQIWLLGQRNALAKCAAELTGAVTAILEWLRTQEGCLDCDMSGSGSTCWGLFATEAEAQATAAAGQAQFPGHWIQPSRVAGATHV